MVTPTVPRRKSEGGRQAARRKPSRSTAPSVSTTGEGGKRELSFREICQIMGPNLRVIEPNERHFELFEEQ
jgi:hypothetical protein